MVNKPEKQLKQEYALPAEGEYNYVTDYKGSTSRKVQIGRTGKNDWGTGGNTQIKLDVKRGDLDMDEDFYRNSIPVKEK